MTATPSPLCLRALEPEDLDFLFAIENDPTIWEVSATGAPYSRYILKQYIASAESIYECGELRLIVADKKTQEAMGVVDLTNFSPLDSRAEVGIAILKKMRGKGIGAEAIRLIEGYACTQLRIQALYAYASPTHNPASHALFLRAGFTPIATLPKWLYRGEKYHDCTFFHRFLKKTDEKAW